MVEYTYYLLYRRQSQTHSFSTLPFDHKAQRGHPSFLSLNHRGKELEYGWIHPKSHICSIAHI